MVRSQTATSTKSDLDEASAGMIQCGNCAGWIYIESTPFKAIEEAKKTPFTCNVCQRLDAMKDDIAKLDTRGLDEQAQQTGTLREQWQTAMKESEREIEALKAELKKESALREQLATEMAAIKAELADVAKKHGEPKRDTPDETTPALQTNQTTKDKDGCGTRKKPKNKEPRNRTPSPTQSHPKIAAPSSTITNDREVNHTPLTPDSETRQPQSPQNSKSRDSRPPRRRTVVLGDSNAHCLKRATLQQVKDRRLRITTKPEASLEETLDRAEGEIARANSTDTILQLILHVGSTELLQGKDTDPTILQLKQKLSSWHEHAPQHRYEVYAVPEIQTRGEEVTKACRQWNADARSMCDQMGTGVLFIDTQAQMAEDGLSYTPATAKNISRQLAERISDFLQRRHNKQGMNSRGRGTRRHPQDLQRTAAETLAQAMTAAFAQMCQTRRY